MSYQRSHAWCFTVSALLAVGGAACSLDDTQPSRAIPPAGPPAPCTAAAASTPFCSPSMGTCPLLADDVLTCPGNGVITTGLATSEQVGLASAPGHGGDVVFATVGGGGGNEQEYVELASFGPTGAATFSLDALPPLPYPGNGGASEAGLVALTGPKGAPVILSTLDGALRAAVGSSASGGTFHAELAVADPYGDDSSDGWYIAGSGAEPDGSIDVLLQVSTKEVLAHRDASGVWTTRTMAPSLDQPVLAVDAAGKVYVAGWTASATSGMFDLQLLVGSSPAVVLATVSQSEVTALSLTVGQSNGAALPVVAFGATLGLAVPDGKGGFMTFQPTLTVATPYVDGCTGSLSLGNCSCPMSCSQVGDEINWVQLVRDSQGDVYVAWLEVDANRNYPVMLNSTSVGSQMITCSCDPQLGAGADTTTAVGLQLDRLVLSPAPHTEHRGTIPVPAQTVSLQATDGNGTLQLLLSGPAAGSTGTLRRVVLDASQLP
jgi:hypothetical protein